MVIDEDFFKRTQEAIDYLFSQRDMSYIASMLLLELKKGETL